MSDLPSDTPKLPKWVFIFCDVVMIAAAVYIATTNSGPLNGGALIAVVSLLAIGVVLIAVPFLTDYARKQDEALDERQRSLEALARTVSTAAEQIGIAANGLHELFDLSHRNLKQAEQLPHKLQEKIAEFQQALAVADDDEKEELERELSTLRDADSERLLATADKVQKSAAEWAKLEAATAKHLAAATEAIARISGAAENGVSKAAVELARAGAATQAVHAKAIDEKLAAALGEADARLAKNTERLLERVASATRQLDEKLVAIDVAIARLAAAPVSAPSAAVAVGSAEKSAQEAVAAAESSSAPEGAPPKRSRKQRREEPAAEVAAATPVEAVAAEEKAAPSEEPAAPAVEPMAGSASLPQPAEQAAVIAELPAGPGNHSSPKAAEPETTVRETAAEELPAVSHARGEFSQASSEESHATSAVSADGATRLLVTAYVGIGNRLFVRGDGPGLSWEKGLPLQFVSIGKWRWETEEATAPVRMKLYKNDQVECPALGEIALDPGHQAEVTANF